MIVIGKRLQALATTLLALAEGLRISSVTAVLFERANSRRSSAIASSLAGCAAGAKVSGLVAGMVAGADSINDMDLLRHGAMGRLFSGVRAPSTYGTFLRAFRFGHVRQLDAVAARFLAGVARHSPIVGTN